MLQFHIYLLPELLPGTVLNEEKKIIPVDMWQQSQQTEVIQFENIIISWSSFKNI